MCFINLHTHRITHSEDVIEIFNEILNSASCANNQYYSSGIHPWFINKETLNEDLKKINEKIQDENCLFLGEIGLDLLTEIPFDLQEIVFKKQVEIANCANKPILIHCVKAFDRLISIKKELKSNVPWIIHGYNSNIQITNQLIKNDLFFSFGKSILNTSKKSIEIIPLNRVFCETDNADIKIQEIYAQVAKCKNLKISQIKNEVFNNFQNTVKMNPLKKQL